jgi:hypothetical protein
MGVVSRGQDADNENFYLGEPDHLHPDLSEACDLLGFSCGFTMSSSITRQLFEAWSAVELSWSSYPVLSRLSDLADPQSQLPKAIAYICPAQSIVYIFASSETELILNGVTVEVALLRFLLEQGLTGVSSPLPSASPTYRATSGYTSRRSHSTRSSEKSSDDGFPRLEKKDNNITTIIEMEDAAKAAADAFDVNDEEAMKIPERKLPMWCPIRMAGVALLTMFCVAMSGGKIYRDWAVGGEAAYPRK